ncbi:hypothetical protein IKD82_02525 [Candidatus Saccharibacteria bacterium]|nr:hypothetical protein [Candidatus Saccharibacteria bacterium]
MAGPAGFASSKARTESSLFDVFVKKWLGQIKQALTIYKEDIRQRLREFNPEEQLT